MSLNQDVGRRSEFFASQTEVGGSTSTVSIAINLIFASTVWLVLADVSPLVMARSYVAFLSVISLGFCLLVMVFSSLRHSLASALWIMGPGLPIGLLLAFLARWGLNKSVFLLVLCAALFVVTTWVFRLVLRARSESDKGLANSITFRFRLHEFFLALGLVALPLVRTWSWMLPATVVAICLAISLKSLSASKTLTRYVGTIGVLIWVLSALYSLRLQSRTWWMLSDDNQFYEALAHSLVERGPASSPIAVANNGLPASAYHHLMFLFAGILEWASGSPAFVALTRASIIFVSVSLVSTLLLAVILLRRLSGVGDSLGGPALVVVSLVLLSSPIDPDPVSNFLGLLALIASLAMVLELKPDARKWQLVVVCCTTVLATAFSKASYLYATPILLVSMILVSKAHRAVILFSTCGATIIVAGFFARFSPQATDLSLSPFNSYSLGELAIGGTASQSLALVVVFASISMGTMCGAVIARQSTEQRIRAICFALVVIVCIGYASRFLVGGRIETIRYYWEPAELSAGILLIVLMSCLPARHVNRVSSHSVLLGTVLGLVWTYLIPMVIPNLNSGSVVAKALRFLRSPTSLTLISTLIVLSMIAHQMHRARPLLRSGNSLEYLRTKKLATLILGAMLGTMLAAAVPSASQQLRESREGLQDVERLPWLGSRDLRDLAARIKFETLPEDKLAIALCDGVSAICQNNYLIAALTDRQFLSLGGMHVTSFGLSDVAKRDIAVSLALGSDSPESAAKTLRLRGVSFVILDSTRISETWRSALVGSDFSEVYENSSFKLLRIN